MSRYIVCKGNHYCLEKEHYRQCATCFNRSWHDFSELNPHIANANICYHELVVI